MCLFRVKQEEDVVIPYRHARKRSPSPARYRRSTHRVSREVVRESRPASSGYLSQRPPSQTYVAPPPPQTYVAVPTPQPLEIPAPQPVPVFVQPPPPPPPPPASHISSHHSHYGGAQYVEVSPRSSVTSHSPDRSEYVVQEREYRRERNYSPESSPRYETFRYVGAPEPEPDRRYERQQRHERSHSRVRERSMSRDYRREEPRGGYRETNTRISVSDGRRRSEYQR